jgi:hypothetical protein
MMTFYPLQTTTTTRRRKQEEKSNPELFTGVRGNGKPSSYYCLLLFPFYYSSVPTHAHHLSSLSRAIILSGRNFSLPTHYMHALASPPSSLAIKSCLFEFIWHMPMVIAPRGYPKRKNLIEVISSEHMMTMIYAYDFSKPRVYAACNRSWNEIETFSELN